MWLPTMFCEQKLSDNTTYLKHSCFQPFKDPKLIKCLWNIPCPYCKPFLSQRSPGTKLLSNDRCWTLIKLIISHKKLLLQPSLIALLMESYLCCIKCSILLCWLHVKSPIKLSKIARYTGLTIHHQNKSEICTLTDVCTWQPIFQKVTKV